MSFLPRASVLLLALALSSPPARVAGALPAEVLRRLAPAVTASFSVEGVDARVALDITLEGSGPRLVPVVRGAMGTPKVTCTAGGTPCQAWTSFQPATDGDPWLAVLVEAPGRATVHLEASLRGEARDGVREAVLELGALRPVRVQGNGPLTFVGVEGVGAGAAPHTGLLGRDPRLGILWSAPDRADARRAQAEALERRLRPPGRLAVDGYYQVRMHGLEARLIVRDGAPYPGPSLSLRMVGKAEVVGVRSAGDGRAVPFRRVGEEELVLEPGPGAGPRTFIVDLAAPGPGEPDRTFKLPTLIALGRDQVPGLIALDEHHPGTDAALVDAGDAAPDAAELLTDAHKQAWEGRSFLLHRAGPRPASLVLTPPPDRREEQPIGLEVTTHLTGGGEELVDLTFDLVAGARWQDLVLTLPPGARGMQLSSEGNLRPLVHEDPGREARPIVRVRVRDGQAVSLRYQRPVTSADGVMDLELPEVSAAIGKFAWAIHAAPGGLVGLPALPEGVDPTGPAASEPPSREGATSAGPSGSPMDVAAAGAEHAPLPETTGGTARVGFHSVARATAVRIRLPVSTAASQRKSLAAIFVAGCLLGLWFLMGAPRDPRFALLPAGGVLLVLGLLGARVSEFPVAWMNTFAEGLGFGVLLVFLAWGLRGERRGPPPRRRPKGPPRPDAPPERPEAPPPKK